MVLTKESWLTRWLHNFVVFALQRKLLQEGFTFQIVSIFIKLQAMANAGLRDELKSC